MYDICLSSNKGIPEKTVFQLLSKWGYSVLDVSNIEDDKTLTETFKQSTLLVVIMNFSTDMPRHQMIAVTRALEIPTIRIVLVHDARKYPLPNVREQHATIRHLFDEVITYLPEYVNTICKKIVERLFQQREKNHTPEIAPTIPENTHTRAFLSHTRVTGNAVARRLYEGLNKDYNVFMSDETVFKLHDLKGLITQTDLFIVIWFTGYLESEYCMEELKCAVENGRKIVVVRHYACPIDLEDIPDEDVHKALSAAPKITWMSEFNSDCIARLKEVALGPSDGVVKAMKEYIQKNNMERDVQNHTLVTLSLKGWEFSVSDFLQGLEVCFGVPLTQVKHLHLYETSGHLSEQDIHYLGKCTQLELLVMSGVQILDITGTPQSLLQVSMMLLGEVNPKLKSASFSKCNFITDESLPFFVKNHTTLESLNLTSCDSVTESTIQAVTNNYPHLKLIFVK